MTAEQINTTCPYCGVGCGVQATLQQQQLIAVSGDTAHPANLGRLCVKGSALHETTDLQNRLLSPEVNGQKVSWDTATDYVAQRLNTIIHESGPDAVAMYLSGQMLTEDYYVANKLMKGFIGTANIDTNSRLCMASAVVAHKRAFGTDTVSGCYEDLELADLVVITGSNLAWAHPIVYQRLAAAKAARPQMKVVVIDPRRTATCDIADLHLPLKPGSDAFLFNGLAHFLISEGLTDDAFIEHSCEHFTELSTSVAQHTLSQSAQDCDLPVATLRQLYEWFGNTERVVTLFSQGINQSSSGVDKGNSIINCHLLSGKIGKPGATPFSITGQPNAMGGREVGGLANQLAAHMELKNPEHQDKVQRFWQAPKKVTQEGLKAVDMFDAITQGRVRAIWIIATNPAVSMPDSEIIREALAQCELVIVSDCNADTDTLAYAHVRLPATTWAEKDGTVTNSERVISRQRGFLPPPGDARHDWQIVCDVAQKMGFNEAFNYASPAAIFREHAALSGFENNNERDFDISGLQKLSDDEYAHLAPIQWPVNCAYPNGRKRFFADGCFYTPSGKAHLVPVKPRLPAFAAGSHGFIMNTGRLRDQWHTMTRTARSARLMEHTATPIVEIHPDTAAHFNLTDNTLLALSGLNQRYIGFSRITDTVRKDSVFVPMHWNRRYASHATANALVKAEKDPLSGQPEFKHSPVHIVPLNPCWQARLLTNLPFAPDADLLWFNTPLQGANLWTLADLTKPRKQAWLTHRFADEIDEWVWLTDSEEHFLRAAGFKAGQLKLVFMAGPELPAMDSRWLASQLEQDFSPHTQRHHLLSGFAADPASQCGKTVCSCFQVGETTIKDALLSGAADSVEALGQQLKCGTNCGSCIPELRSLVNEYAAKGKHAA